MLIMSTERHLICAMVTFTLALFTAECLAKVDSPASSDINTLYDIIIQRKYAGSMTTYPNHPVERKARRLPSMRLRFGRRRDPSMPLQHNAIDLLQKKNGHDAVSSYNMDYDDVLFGRIIRKPQRLRWGR